MDVSKYPSNSFKSKEKSERVEDKREKHIEPVVTGKVSRIKKTETRRIFDSLASGNIDATKQYVVRDIIVPGIKDLIADTAKTAIDVLFYGERKGSSQKGRASRVSYRQYYVDQDSRGRRRGDDRRIAPERGYWYDDLKLDTRSQAEDVLLHMRDIVDCYGTMSVGDFYDLCDEQPKHTDYKYGWDNLDDAYVVRVRNGYVIKLPRAIPLD